MFAFEPSHTPSNSTPLYGPASTSPQSFTSNNWGGGGMAGWHTGSKGPQGMNLAQRNISNSNSTPNVSHNSTDESNSLSPFGDVAAGAGELDLDLGPAALGFPASGQRPAKQANMLQQTRSRSLSTEDNRGDPGVAHGGVFDLSPSTSPSNKMRNPNVMGALGAGHRLSPSNASYGGHATSHNHNQYAKRGGHGTAALSASGVFGGTHGMGGFNAYGMQMAYANMQQQQQPRQGQAQTGTHGHSKPNSRGHNSRGGHHSNQYWSQ